MRKIFMSEEGNGHWRAADIFTDLQDTETAESVDAKTMVEFWKFKVSQDLVFREVTDFIKIFQNKLMELKTSEASYIIPERVEVKPKMLPLITRTLSYIFIAGAVGLSVFNFETFMVIPHFILVSIGASILTIWVTYLEPFKNPKA